ncbi:STAS domain-containing protein [Streptacidiphilus sp. N1-12]|uniref:STAS domain-containing protein n=2 Tax=Streptacidiphilus alkalitolerans TaxID=3342712 RepID=A0ABV6W9R2_9ACTN
MSSGLTLEARPRQGTQAVLALAGVLDLDSADALAAAASDLVERGSCDLVLEMAQVTFCDSMGLNALLRVLRQAKGAGGSLTLLSPSDPVKRLLSMCGVDQIISAHDGPSPG